MDFSNIFKYITSYWLEFRYRFTYILFFVILNIIILLFFWTEIILFMLEPLDNVMFKNSNTSMYFLYKSYYISEDLNIKDHLSLANVHTFNNDLPYFEISIKNVDNIDYTIVYVSSIYLTLIIVPFLFYQNFLLFIPMMYKYEVKRYTKKLLWTIIITYIYFFFAIFISMPFFFRFLLFQTEELSNIEFDTDFNFETYITNYQYILQIHLMLLVFLSIKRWSRFFFIVLLILVYYILCTNEIVMVILLIAIYIFLLFIATLSSSIKYLLLIIRYKSYLLLFNTYDKKI